MSTQKKLTETDVEKRLTKLTTWTANAKRIELTKTFEVPTFVAGLALAARITVHAEVLGHHPRIELSYGKVKVHLTTHDVKALTKLDFDLAKRIDSLKVVS